MDVSRRINSITFHFLALTLFEKRKKNSISFILVGIPICILNWAIYEALKNNFLKTIKKIKRRKEKKTIKI